MSGATLGVDVGGSSIRALVRSDSGQIISSFESAHDAHGGSAVVELIVASARSAGLEGCAAIGVGVPGQVFPESGSVSLAVNLGIGASELPLGARVARALGVPVVVENDVRVAALGMHEILRQRGAPVSSLTLFSIGTGIAAGVVIDGELVRGSHGMAGEIGHVVVDESGERCVCGQRGCLETVAAGPAIAAAWGDSRSAFQPSSLFSRAECGDEVAQELASRVAGHLTTAITWMAAAYDTELVVLTGGVTAAGSDFLTIVRREIAARAASSELAARRLQPKGVILADASNPPGPLGAAILAASPSLQQRVSPAHNEKSKQQPLGGTV